MKTRVYTGGTFDILHAGHVNFLRKIKGLFPDCFLIVSLNTDEFIKEYKGIPPIFNYEERKSQLYMLGLVDIVIQNIGGADSKPAIENGRPDIIAIGTDWLKKDYCKQMGFTPEWLENKKINLIYIPYTKEVSTTMIKERIKNAR